MGLLMTCQVDAAYEMLKVQTLLGIGQVFEELRVTWGFAEEGL